jgi:hypothetical protein
MPVSTVRPDAAQHIDRYIAGTADFARPICSRLRKIIRAADPEIVEDWKWGPNYSKHGMICGYGAFKAHVTLTFFKGVAMKDPKQILEPCSADNAHNRSVKFRDVREIDEKTLTAYVREAAKLNVSGVIVESRRAQIGVPLDFKKALAASKKAKQYFDTLTPGYRRDYLQWIIGAKRPETRAARIKQAVRQCSEGKTLHYKYQK